MRVASAMTRDVCTLEPTASAATAAYLMRDRDIGILPVVDHGAIVGVVTDRDIAMKVFVGGVHAGSPIFRLMSATVHTCSDDEEIDCVLARMAALRIRRMPVCGRSGELVGIISIGDIAQCAGEAPSAAAYADICWRHGLPRSFRRSR